MSNNARLKKFFGDYLDNQDATALADWEYTRRWFTPELEGWAKEQIGVLSDELIYLCIDLTESLAYEPGNLKVSESPEAFVVMFQRIMEHTIATMKVH